LRAEALGFISWLEITDHAAENESALFRRSIARLEPPTNFHWEKGMTSIKSQDQFLERDPTNDFFSLLTLEHLYGSVSQYCTLHEGVPEDIRDYSHVVVTLFLYGWLYYPFYTLASERSFFAIEMALRKRLPGKKLDKKGRDRRSLGELLKEARDAGLLRDEGFPSLDNRRATAQELNQHMSGILGREPEPQPEVPYVDVLISTSPWLRNRFAHPDMQSILTPGQALDGLILAAEIINQLWIVPSKI
jgi:hypothetical protein